MGHHQCVSIWDGLMCSVNKCQVLPVLFVSQEAGNHRLQSRDDFLDFQSFSDNSDIIIKLGRKHKEENITICSSRKRGSSESLKKEIFPKTTVTLSVHLL